MRRVRIVLWVLVAFALAAFAFLMLRPAPNARLRASRWR